MTNDVEMLLFRQIISKALVYWPNMINSRRGRECGVEKPGRLTSRLKSILLNQAENNSGGHMVNKTSKLERFFSLRFSKSGDYFCRFGGFAELAAN
jgi:hypothetical protein